MGASRNAFSHSSRGVTLPLAYEAGPATRRLGSPPMDATSAPRTIAMLVGGGPAPGLNGVINSVTLSARARGWRVLGVPKGFSQLMAGDVSGVRELTEADVDGIATRGGSVLYTARANP